LLAVLAVLSVLGSGYNCLRGFKPTTLVTAE